MNNRAVLRAALCATTILCGVMPSALLAQGVGTVAPPPVRRAIDANGVDVIRMTYNITQTDLSIGGKGHHGLYYERQNINGSFTSSAVATIDQSGSTVLVTLGNRSDRFTVSGSTYTPTEGNGASLVSTGGYYVYTTRDGTVARFDSDANYYYSVYKSSVGRVSEITYADGTKEFYIYKIQDYCGAGWENGDCPSGVKSAIRLQGINNSNGYQLKFAFSENGTEINRLNYTAWSVPASVKAINRGVEFCDASVDSCALSGSWPTATYTRTSDPSGNVTNLVTDAANRTTRYYKGALFGPLTVRRPGYATDNVTVNYSGTPGAVSSVTRDGVTHSYAFTDAGSVRTTTVTDPLSGQTVYTSDTVTNLIGSVRDELLRTTSYLYDGSGRVTRITSPEGNYTSYSYDARGNATEVRSVAKSGSGLSDIVATSAFPASCASTITCNKPTSTTDARGKVTDYTYDATHGGVTSVTAPAPTPGAVRPQTRYGYTTHHAYVKPSVAGAPAASGVPTYMLTTMSQCQTLASCTGAADEVKTAIGYGPQSAGTANNLLPVTASSGSGNGALTATVALTYDGIGNRTIVDGPLSGTADTTRMLYNSVRQTVGVIGPDPDGGGALKNRAQRLTYNPDGQVINTEQGTTTGQSDTNWAAFASLQETVSAYDGNARKASDTLRSGGTSYSLAQYSYDALGRSDCTALRMNSAVFGSLPASACTLGTTGSFGSDRIARTIYNAASEVTKTQSALGTADQADDATMTYTLNGRTRTVTDANGNLTLYEFDGFDRALNTWFPSPTTPGQITATDYEQLAYDAGSNVTGRRLRDGQVIGFTYDALNRVTFKDVPAGAYHEVDVSYAWDNLGRSTSVSGTNGHYLNRGYDALGRVVSEASWYGTKTMQYDLAGRTTRLTWPDAFYVTYDYLVTGEVQYIRENGAASGIGVLGTYAYDNLGRRTMLTRGNGTTIAYAYDPVGRLASLGNYHPVATHDVNWSFGYNPASQIVSSTRSNDAYAWNGHYNVDRPYSVNGLNQLATAGATALGYDGRGNLSSSGASTYQYTSENRLATTGSGVYLANDPAGRLVQIYANGGAQHTPLDYLGDKLITEMNSSNVLIRRYVHGPGNDEPLVWYEGAGTSDRRWLDVDERGSVIGVTNASGATLAINSYDEYGIPASTNLGRFQYTGQAWIPELGMYYYKARIYSPTLGRFLQTDPIGYGDGMNLYAYVGGDPINFTDPSGLKEKPDQGAVKRIKPEDDDNTDEQNDRQDTIVVTGSKPPPPVSNTAALVSAGSGPISSGGGGGGTSGDHIVGDDIVVTGEINQETVSSGSLVLVAAGFDSGLPRDAVQLETMLKEAKKAGDTELARKIIKQQKMLGVRNIGKLRGLGKFRGFFPPTLIPGPLLDPCYAGSPIRPDSCGPPST